MDRVADEIDEMLKRIYKGEAENGVLHSLVNNLQGGNKKKGSKKNKVEKKKGRKTKRKSYIKKKKG